MRLDILASPSPFIYLTAKYSAIPKLKPPRILYLFSLIKLIIEVSIINQYKQVIKFLIKLYFYSKMIDFSRTFCDLHPNQLISNFCSRQQCNIGLCATCICSHTETHMQKHTAPEYQNIRATYSKMQDSIRTRISELQQQKLRINNLVENIQNKRKMIGNTITQAREEALEFVNKFFDAKQKEIMRKLEADQKKFGLHNENRMDSLNNFISRDINSLFAAAQDLNSASFLQSFHRIRTQVLANSLQTQKEISDQLDKNQNYEAILTINPIYINQVKLALDKSLQFCWQEKKFGQKILEIKDNRESFNKSSRIMINQSENPNPPINLVQKRPQSMPKQSFSSQMSRCSSNILQPYVPSFVKQPVQQIQQMQQIYQQPIRYQPQPFIQNNSTPLVQPKPIPNYNSRIQMRVNSSQKNIKENGLNKHPLTQSYMDINFSIPPSQLDANKKIRRSGLTVLRAVDNETKS